MSKQPITSRKADHDELFKKLQELLKLDKRSSKKSTPSTFSDVFKENPVEISDEVVMKEPLPGYFDEVQEIDTEGSHDAVAKAIEVINRSGNILEDNQIKRSDPIMPNYYTKPTETTPGKSEAPFNSRDAQISILSNLNGLIQTALKAQDFNEVSELTRFASYIKDSMNKFTTSRQTPISKNTLIREKSPELLTNHKHDDSVTTDEVLCRDGHVIPRSESLQESFLKQLEANGFMDMFKQREDITKTLKPKPKAKPKAKAKKRTTKKPV